MKEAESMKIKHIRRALGTFILAVVSSSSTVVTAGLPDVSPNGPTRIVNEAGWQVAGLSASRIMAPRRPLEGFGSSAVYVTFLKPDEEVLTQIPIFWLTDGGATLNTRQQGVAERSIRR